jgi:hypothetical protein
LIDNVRKPCYIPLQSCGAVPVCLHYNFRWFGARFGSRCCVGGCRGLAFDATHKAMRKAGR